MHQIFVIVCPDKRTYFFHTPGLLERVSTSIWISGLGVFESVFPQSSAQLKEPNTGRPSQPTQKKNYNPKIPKWKHQHMYYKALKSTEPLFQALSIQILKPHWSIPWFLVSRKHPETWRMHIYLVVSTHLKAYAPQFGSSPQVGFHLDIILMGSMGLAYMPTFTIKNQPFMYR